MGIYEELGLEPIVNAAGSLTRLGGAAMPDPVLEAYRRAARDSVPLEQLQAAASRRIAQLFGTEAALVTSGAAAALTLGAAALLARLDPGRMERLPETSDFPNQIVVAREQRSGYDHAVRAAGARLVEVGFDEVRAGTGVRRTETWEYEAAFSEHTVGVLYVLTPSSKPPLGEVVQVAQRHEVPVLVDASAQASSSDPGALGRLGVDLLCLSGGKQIRGPQNTGILAGRRDLIAAAALQMLDLDDHPELWQPPSRFIDRTRLPGLPRHGIGRGLKVSKESIVALLAALQHWARGDWVRDQAERRSWLEALARCLDGLPVSTTLEQRLTGSCQLVGQLKIPDASVRAFELCRALRRGSPPIYVGHAELERGRFVIDPTCLRGDQIEPLGHRLADELRRLTSA